MDHKTYQPRAEHDKEMIACIRIVANTAMCRYASNSLLPTSSHITTWKQTFAFSERKCIVHRKHLLGTQTTHKLIHRISVQFTLIDMNHENKTLGVTY